MSGTSKPHGANNSQSTESDIDETVTMIVVLLTKGVGMVLWWSVLFPMLSIPTIASVWVGLRCGPLLGVVLATPFLVLASVVAAHITSLADSVRVDVLCVALASVSIAVRIADGRSLQGKTEQVQSSDVESSGDTDLRGKSTISLSC